ncbi:MAG: murein L,D-transpeptidase family protein [Hyphomicrobium sp.]
MSAAVVAISAAMAATNAVAAEPAAAKPISSDIQTLIKTRAIAPSAPIYIRVFKEESELEVWKARNDGRYVAIKTYPICKWSGTLGPKQALGDHMAPEGFYGFTSAGLKPDSKYHLALNVGYPNALDRALGRSGDFIMIHGQCVSVGCFAMTNDLIEEIYALARESLEGGAERVPVHIFPFRMTATNIKRHADHPATLTWGPLKEAFNDFSRTQEPPRIGVCGSRYVVNPIASLDGGAKDACPTRIGKRLAPLSPKKARKLAFLSTPLFADGPKTRTVEDIAAWDGSEARATLSDIAAREENRKKRKSDSAANSADNGGLTPYLAQ